MKYSEALAKAEGAIGTTEWPKYSNCNIFAPIVDAVWWLGFSRNCQQWCGTFTDWLLGKDMVPRSSFSVIYGMEGFKQTGRWTHTPQPGYLCFMSFSASRVAGHIGWVRTVVNDNTVITIEGNTSVSYNGSQSNGGGVYQRVRSGAVILGYGVVEYEPEEVELPEFMVKSPTYQNIFAIYASGIVRGLYGVAEFQRYISQNVPLVDNASVDDVKRLSALAGPGSGDLVPV